MNGKPNRNVGWNFIEPCQAFLSALKISKPSFVNLRMPGRPWRAEGLGNRLKGFNLKGDATASEKSSKIGRQPTLSYFFLFPLIFKNLALFPF